MTKIGDTLYRYMRENQNRQGSSGKLMPLWSPNVITGESHTHWHLGNAVNLNKVNKKTLREKADRGYTDHQWYTKEGKADKEWRGKHVPGIYRWLESATTDQLKKIAAIIGYKEDEAS